MAMNKSLVEQIEKLRELGVKSASFDPLNKYELCAVEFFEPAAPVSTDEPKKAGPLDPEPEIPEQYLEAFKAFQPTRKKADQ